MRLKLERAKEFIKNLSIFLKGENHTERGTHEIGNEVKLCFNKHDECEKPNNNNKNNKPIYNGRNNIYLITNYGLQSKSN
jgi:hypothetical protein